MYDGAQLILKISLLELKSFEEKRDNEGESIVDSISEKIREAKEKVVDTTKNLRKQKIQEILLYHYVIQ